MTSFIYQCMERMIRAAGIKKYYQMDKDELMSFYERKLRKQKCYPPKRMYKMFHIEEKEYLGCPCYCIHLQNESQKAVLFLHGGGYMIEIDNIHWKAVERIAERTKSMVVVPIYPLAPIHSYKEVFLMLQEIYADLLKKFCSRDIVMIGDSAGAQLVLSFCQECLEREAWQPAKMILLSPPVDFAPDSITMSKYEELDKVDPMISINIIKFLKEVWARDTEMSNYHISPINGSFTGLPPMELFCGTKEMMYATIDTLKEKAEKAGVPVTLHIGQDMMHVWPYYLWSIESKQGFEQVIKAILT